MISLSFFIEKHGKMKDINSIFDSSQKSEGKFGISDE